MGFNRRKMNADRKAKADAEAVARRASDAQVLEDAERLIGAWNERQAKRMRSAARSQRITGFSGFAVQPAGRRAASTCARSIVTATLP
jgi:hypothetical protein